MHKTLAELNTIAQEIANKLGHISQELLIQVHALVTATETKISNEIKECTASEKSEKSSQ
jgi:hypothetical protein